MNTLVTRPTGGQPQRSRLQRRVTDGGNGEVGGFIG
jgi:hypothetical protein